MHRVSIIFAVVVALFVVMFVLVPAAKSVGRSVSPFTHVEG